MKKSVFYHAGCSVCVSAENEIVELLGTDNVEIVHLGEEKTRIQDAESLGIKSVPVLVTPSGGVLHLNFGASIDELRA